jgi:hypothetical protein
MAAALGLPERREPELRRQVAAVVDWLREHERWLIVLDDLEHEVSALLPHLLPPDLPGRILATSRTPTLADRLHLDVLPHEAVAQYLMERTEQRDTASAETVANALGGLPLVLEHAAAYLAATGRQLADYAETLRRRSS